MLRSFKNIFFVFIGAYFLASAKLSQKPQSYSIKIIVEAPMQNHIGDTVFIVGNFNDWASNKSAMLLDPSTNKWTMTISNMDSSYHEFKFTRGNWSKVQCSELGENVENFKIHLKSDTVINCKVLEWLDNFPAKNNNHTATSSVKIVSENFDMPQLNTHRRIWIYLPASYEISKKYFPVIYMQDGQNLFDNKTSAFGEWGVDEIMDSLISAGQPSAIVVGIDNGKNRVVEYNPFNNEKYGEGRGDQYLEFIVNNLKPYIDRHYRTLSQKENTIIAGSSMGGLISYYAAVKYPNVFGKAGVLSPAFWIAPDIIEYSNKSATRLNTKMFFSIGKAEGEIYVNDMLKMADLFASKSSGMIYCLIDENAKHNEEAWHSVFPDFYKWIISSSIVFD